MLSILCSVSIFKLTRFFFVNFRLIASFSFLPIADAVLDEYWRMLYTTFLNCFCAVYSCLKPDVTFSHLLYYLIVQNF